MLRNNQKNEKLIQQYNILWCSSSGGHYCCMCDQMIPKNGVIQFAVKIIQNDNIMIGIGFRDIVQSKNYQNCYSIGGGYIYDNDKQIVFQFAKNDIIIVEVDIEKKHAKRTKQSTNESFTLTIDTSKHLYLCVHLYGISKVQILNQLFK